MAPIRIAIFDCDPLIEPIRERNGDYGGVITAFLHAGAEHIGLPLDELHLSVWSVEERQEYPALEDIDSILISGSRLSAYDDKAWIDKLVDYIKQVLDHDTVKILGLCFGHQVVGRALGAEGAINTLGYEMSVCKVDMTPPGAKIFGKDQLAVHQMHHDILCSYPSGVTPLGTSPVCEVQGMYLPRKFLTLQGHPEFNEEIMLELLKASDELGFEDKALYNDAMSRVHNKHDGTLVAATMLKFLKSELDI